MNTIYTLLRVTIICIIFAYFILTSLKSRYRYNQTKTRMLALLLIIITATITVLFLTSGKFLSDYSTLGIVLWIISALTIFHIVIKGSYLEVLFIVLVVLNLYVNIIAIARIIVCNLTSGNYTSSFYALVTIGVFILYIPLLWILFHKLYKKVIEFQINLFFWKFLWVIPALCYLIFYVKIINDYWKTPVESTPYDVAFIILWSLTTYILFCVTLLMLIQAYHGITSAEETKLTTSLLRMQEEQYKNLLKNMDQTARSRHDWRHHLLTINGFAENGALAELETYIQSLFPQYLSDIDIQLCKNHVVDIILQHYASIAKIDDIEMEISADIPDNIGIMDIDLCVIFGNLTENAVDACMNQTDGVKYIQLKSYTAKKQLVVQIKNTYDNNLILEDGGYLSTKHEGYGVGLSSVKKVTEKYNGVLKVHPDSDYFIVDLLFFYE